MHIWLILLQTQLCCFDMWLRFVTALEEVLFDRASSEQRRGTSGPVHKLTPQACTVQQILNQAYDHLDHWWLPLDEWSRNFRWISSKSWSYYHAGPKWESSPFPSSKNGRQRRRRPLCPLFRGSRIDRFVEKKGSKKNSGFGGGNLSAQISSSNLLFCGRGSNHWKPHWRAEYIVVL